MSYTKLLAFSCFLLPVWMFGCSGSDPTPDASSGARACESAADCLDPLVEYCVLVDEEGHAAERCEASRDSACLPHQRGCSCVVGAHLGNPSREPGSLGVACID